MHGATKKRATLDVSTQQRKHQRCKKHV